MPRALTPLLSEQDGYDQSYPCIDPTDGLGLDGADQGQHHNRRSVASALALGKPSDQVTLANGKM